MERKDLVRMAVDLHNKTPQGNYSLDEMNDILKKAVFGKDYENYFENGKFDIYRATRDGKIDYALIEQIITEGTKRELDAASPILGYIDWQNYAEGDTLSVKLYRAPGMDEAIQEDRIDLSNVGEGDYITVTVTLRGAAAA